MGTVTEKLTKVIQTKKDIAAAIVEKGINVSSEEAFSDYANKIKEIHVPSIIIYGGTEQ